MKTNAMLLLLMAMSICVTTAQGSVLKRFFAEDFGGIFCIACIDARCALDELHDEYGSQFFTLESHVGESDPFTTPETTARADRYGVVGIPLVVIDGTTNFLGATSCPDQIPRYRDALESAMHSWDYVSPVEITGGLEIDGDTATITARFLLVDDGYSFTEHQAVLYLYEDDVPYCCGSRQIDHWNKVVRMVRATPVSLTFQGQEVEVVESLILAEQTVPINPLNLHAVAIYEEMAPGGKNLQATDFTPFPNFFTATVSDPTESVPQGNGTAYFETEISSYGSNSDVLDLSIGGFDGGATGWNVAFRIEGQSDWHSSYALPIDGGSTVHVTLRVQTDGELWLGQGELVVESENSGEHRAVMVEVFNASPAILAIDDDQNGTYETDLVGAITAGGYLYKTFTVGPYNDSDGPDLATMNQYDGVIWQTGFTPRTLTDNDLAALSSYLDMGRKLYLQSMDYLTYDGTKPFTSTYLGVSTYTNDARADAAVGVPGDPITDGMNFPALQWPAPAYNKADVVEPLPSAHAILHKETGQPIALRNELSNGARIAFNTVLLRALGNGPDPSNRTQFVGRTLDWLFTRGPADVPETTVGSAEWGMLSASPNPFTTSAAGTELRFSLSESASQKPVSLTVVDASGRQVRHLQDGNSGPSPRSVRWDGRDDAGRLLSSGVYWAVLRSTDGTSTVKLTHVE